MSHTKTTFVVGDSVEHPKYGRGKVVAVNPQEKQIVVEVDEDQGRYWIYYVSMHGWKNLSPVPVGTSPVTFVVGDDVVHSSWGRGTIREVYPDSCSIQVDLCGGRDRSTGIVSMEGWTHVAEKVQEVPLPAFLKKETIEQETARCFTFDDSNPIQYMWIVHRFVIGEPVVVKSAVFERAGVIDSVLFESGKFGVKIRLELAENAPLTVLVWEDAEGQLPIRPTNLRPDEEVVHPKFGLGKIAGVDEEGGVIVKFVRCIRWMKGRKLRRIHLSPEPFSAPVAA
jgi:hypothetical protein